MNNFEFDKFKVWLNNQTNSTNETGISVESKISLRKLVEKIELDDSSEDIEEVAKSFKKHGGIITESNGNAFTVKSKKGTFIISKLYVKKL